MQVGAPTRRPDLAERVRTAYAQGGGGDVLDARGDIVRITVDGAEMVAKRRPRTAALRERRLALAARQRLAGLNLRGLGTVTVVVPDVVELDRRQAALLTPHLGPTLGDGGPGDRTAAGRFPLRTLRATLAAMLDRGVDSSGFVPRNLFTRPAGVAAIDWEDARLADGPVAPHPLTLMKLDIAWSDIYRRDPELRLHHWGPPTDDRVRPDRFESVLGGLMPRASDVRATGIALTLRSELHVPSPVPVTAARLGHLAEDVLGPRLSVCHTVLTAHLRASAGDRAYGRVLTGLWAAVGDDVAAAARSRRSAVTGRRRLWMRALCTLVDSELRRAGQHTAGPSLGHAARTLAAHAGDRGWAAALRRAAAVEVLLCRVASLVCAAVDADEQLLLRGSLAQGVLGRRSDVDFELSSPRHPTGQRPLERLLTDVLGCFGVRAEGSAARPVERDIVGADPDVSRDLHEWMELRRPGSPWHDPGWTAGFLTAGGTRLTRQRSEYERRGREHSAKYLWFETRALVSRLVFGACPRPSVLLAEQLDTLTGIVGPEVAGAVTGVVRESFDARELERVDDRVLAPLRDRVDLLRAALSLPGPATGSPDTGKGVR